MVFRDKIDVLYNPYVTARRRRIEWPIMNPEMLNKVVAEARKQGVPGVVKQEAIQLLNYVALKPDANSSLIVILESSTSGIPVR
jgi:hypothetical protein